MELDKVDLVLIHHFVIPHIFTEGEGDHQKREEIRKSASKGFPCRLPNCKWFASSIKVKRNSAERKVDIENIPKLIIDAFAEGIVRNDESVYSNLVLHADDDLKNVRALTIEGDFCQDASST